MDGYAVIAADTEARARAPGTPQKSPAR
jgi:hypothetical protein